MNNDNQADTKNRHVLEPEEIYLTSSIPLVERSTLFDFMVSSSEKTEVKVNSESNQSFAQDSQDDSSEFSDECELEGENHLESSSAHEDSADVAAPEESSLLTRAPSAKSNATKGKVELEEHLKMLCDAELIEQIQNIPRRISFKIGEVAELVGVKSFVLRFWETEFDLLKPKKASNNQRMYSRKDVEVSFLIKKLLYRDRFSIEGARNVIKQARLQMKAEVSKLEEVPASKHKFESVAGALKDKLTQSKKNHESATENETQLLVEYKDVLKLHLQVDRISEQVKNLKQLFS